MSYMKCKRHSHNYAKKNVAAHVQSIHLHNHTHPPPTPLKSNIPNLLNLYFPKMLTDSTFFRKASHTVTCTKAWSRNEGGKKSFYIYTRHYHTTQHFHLFPDIQQCSGPQNIIFFSILHNIKYNLDVHY